MFEVVDMGSFGQIIEEIEAAPEFVVVRVKYVHCQVEHRPQPLFLCK